MIPFSQLLRTLDVKQSLLALVDITVVAYLLYRLILLAKGRRAWPILIGLGVFFVLLLASDRFGLVTLNWILRQFVPLGPVALVVLFYPELRDVLERLGRPDFWGAQSVVAAASRQPHAAETIEAVVTAATLLSARKIGALMVLERETGLDDVVANGTKLDAIVTPELLNTIFEPGTPLHDGAVILRDGRLVAAGCTLPLSDAPNIATNIHTRHRAAMGVSEKSDAIVVVVSEETGTISIATGGKLIRGLKPDTLRERLLDAFGVIPRRSPRITFRSGKRKEEAAK